MMTVIAVLACTTRGDGHIVPVESEYYHPDMVRLMEHTLEELAYNFDPVSVAEVDLDSGFVLGLMDDWSAAWYRFECQLDGPDFHCIDVFNWPSTSEIDIE